MNRKLYNINGVLYNTHKKLYNTNKKLYNINKKDQILQRLICHTIMLVLNKYTLFDSSRFNHSDVWSSNLKTYPNKRTFSENSSAQCNRTRKLFDHCPETTD